MVNEKIEQLLKESFTLVNGAARVTSPKLLERCIDDAFQQAGADWLVETADRFRLADARGLRNHLDRFLARLKTEEGHAELKRYVSTNERVIKQWRRKLVQLTHMTGFGEQGTEFTFDNLPDNGGIYRILVDSRHESGEGDENEERHDNHPCQ